MVVAGMGLVPPVCHPFREAAVAEGGDDGEGWGGGAQRMYESTAKPVEVEEGPQKSRNPCRKLLKVIKSY